MYSRVHFSESQGKITKKFILTKQNRQFIHFFIQGQVQLTSAKKLIFLKNF